RTIDRNIAKRVTAAIFSLRLEGAFRLSTVLTVSVRPKGTCAVRRQTGEFDAVALVPPYEFRRATFPHTTRLPRPEHGLARLSSWQPVPFQSRLHSGAVPRAGDLPSY